MSQDEKKELSLEEQLLLNNPAQKVASDYRPELREFVKKTVEYLLDQGSPSRIRVSVEPVFLVVEDVEIVQMALRYRLSRYYQQDMSANMWNGLDVVDWKGKPVPDILSMYFALREQGAEIAVVAIDYDLSEGENVTTLNGKDYAWSGVDIAAAIRFLEKMKGYSPVFIWPNSIHKDNNEAIFKVCELVTGVNEMNSVSTEFRSGNNKCAFLDLKVSKS